MQKEWDRNCDRRFTALQFLVLVQIHTEFKYTDLNSINQLPVQNYPIFF